MTLTQEEKTFLDGLFPNVIGQYSIKNKLSLLASIQNTNGLIGNLLICGPYGSGKNLITKSLAKLLINLEDRDRKKTFIEVNSATIGNITSLFQDVIIPNVSDRYVTLNLDEAHKLPEEVQVALLTITNPNPENINTYTFNQNNFIFDLRKLSIILTTSDPNKLLTALINRLERIDMESYTQDDLIKIILKNTRGIYIDAEILPQIASVCRNNARETEKISSRIKQYCQLNNIVNFNKNNWANICGVLNIRPLGINNLEYKILSVLKKNPNCSLTRLSAILGLSTNSIRTFYEMYLLSSGFLEVVPGKGRNLTYLGNKYLEEIGE